MFILYGTSVTIGGAEEAVIPGPGTSENQKAPHII